MKCDKCLNSRPVISENGIHNICTLSTRAALKCLKGEKDCFVELRMTDIFNKQKGDDGDDDTRSH